MLDKISALILCKLRGSVAVSAAFDQQENPRQHHRHDLGHHDGPPDALDAQQPRQQLHRATWNTKVRRKEMMAEVTPSLRAVKKPDPKMAKPMNRKDKAKMRKPFTVSSSSPAS